MKAFLRLKGVLHTFQNQYKNIRAFALSFSLINVLFCVCLAHAGQRGVGNPAATGVAFQDVLLKGRVVSAESNAPFHGATVTIKNTGIKVLTDADGTFTIKGNNREGVLVISYVGYKAKEIPFDDKSSKILSVQLAANDNVLDEAVVIGYGQTTRRLNTGSVSKVTAEDISRQPVSNPLAALQGRVPGLLISQNSGVPGAGFNVQLRGQNSILQGSEPFFIIDGVPLVNGNRNMSGLSNASGGISPLNALNPNDIESIEVLKDADATAIYGSRGANGVILITTKKNKSGVSSYQLNLYSGFSKATRTMEMLNTQQYVMMRKEAFQNDLADLTTANAPDLLLWDTTRYTNLKNLLMGGTARTHDAQLSLSGGNKDNQFLLGGGLHKETTVFPGDLGDIKGTFHANLNHRSANDRFELNFSTNYGYNSSNLTTRDLSSFIILPPHIKLYDQDGNLNWQEGNISFQSLGLTNPLAQLQAGYDGKFQNLSSNLTTTYKILTELTFKTSFGYNQFNGNEHAANPSTSLDPAGTTKPYAFFNTSNRSSWIIEPQIIYNKHFRNTDWQLLLGSTFQENSGKGLNASGRDYASDMLLGSINAAGSVITNNSYDQYRYIAFFSRVNVNHKNRYILNLTGRRDGSSRFGPGKQFANFGALGGAWIFSEEAFMKGLKSLISYTKLRGSYGITGNDQIGNYQYLDSWSTTFTTYQGVSALQPSRLYNPDYSWEINKKLEFGFELGLFEDRLMLSTSWFRNRGRNQLVNYQLPIQTGFNSVIHNLNALVENKGWEFGVSSNIPLGKVQWHAGLNLTLPKNTLRDFPGIEQSSYANSYVIGQPLSVKRSYRFLGVDPETGIYQFEDVNADGVLDVKDRMIYNHLDPKFYGGFNNSFTIKSFSIDLFFEFRKQQGRNYLGSIGTPPGYRFTNHPEIVLSRWQHSGDETNIQRFVGLASSPAYRPGYAFIRDSEAIFSDASFVRLKTLALTYRIPVAAQWPVKQLEVSGQAQNLFTLTKYKGSDPETQNLYALPPMRTIVVGLKAIF